MFKEILTNPKEHNPRDFIYLVHGFLDWGIKGITPQGMKDRINKVRDPNRFYNSSIIAHLNKESAKKRIGWCNGEVDQMGTFGGIGLILNPASEDLIGIAWNCNLRSPLDPKELEEFVYEHWGKIRDPCTLLTQTKGILDASNNYNHLILKGDKDTGIQGVFYKPKEKYMGKQLGELASEIMQSEVPIIELPSSIGDYDNIKDPKERIKILMEDYLKPGYLKSKSEMKKVHLEFLQT